MPAFLARLCGSYPAAIHRVVGTALLIGVIPAAIFSNEPGGSLRADDLRVLSASADSIPGQDMLRLYLRGLSHEALDRRRALFESLRTDKQIIEYQQRMRLFFREQLGGFPERTPLNARTVGRLTCDGFRVEKVIYESQPGFYVTANLYLPQSPPPYPGVLFSCGHSEEGKATEAYQRASILMAKHGLAVLCFDPVGQSERKQLLDHMDQPRFPPTTEHLVEGVAPILLGENLARYMIWDGMRGLDYLASRNDINPARLGCTGNSGGGNLTSYLMALDERIVCAAPSCFITTTRRKNDSPGPGDAEQNIFAQTAFGMDHADYLLMRAPQPTLICAATRDFVPIEGAWESFRQAKRLYTRLGFAERVDLVEADAKHGFSPLLRVAATRWLRRWLLGRHDAITEEQFPVMTQRQLQCSRHGQVLLMDDARSIFDLYAAKETTLAQERGQLWSASTPSKMREAIRGITGIRRLDNIPQPTWEITQSIARDRYCIDKLLVRPTENIVLPALLWVPRKASGKRFVYVHGEGKHVDANVGGPIEQLVLSGHTVLAVDVRGCGETQCRAWRYGRAAQLLGTNVAEFYLAYMLGKSLLAMRCEDLLICARLLTTHPATAQPAQGVHLIAVGEAGPVALHAAALEGELFNSLLLRGSLVSWSNVVRTPVTKGQLPNTVHGALRKYDLPDLLHLIPPEKVTLLEPRDAVGRPVRSRLTARDTAGEQVVSAQIERGNLSVRFQDNSQSPRLLSGIQSLFHVKHAPDFDAFDPDSTGASAGLNFEHIISGHRNSANKFSPRHGNYDLYRLPDGKSVILVRDSVHSPWAVGSTLQYTVNEPHYIDLEFRCVPHEKTRFGPRGHATFFFANYMNDVDEVPIHFRGLAAADGHETWIIGNAPNQHPDWNHGGTYRSRRASQLPIDDDQEFRLNSWSYHYPRFSKPFYFGKTRQGMVFILMFDRMYSDVDEIRFSIFKFKLPRKPRPAWDFQYVIRKIVEGKQYGFRSRLVWKPFVSVQDCLQEYESWAAGLAGDSREYP